MKMYNFPCGCSFPILEERPDDIPLLDMKIREVNPTCPIVWEMLAKGLTKGIFQLESGLGRQWTKRLKPTEIEHLFALSSILRPGSMNAFLEDGKSVTEHYCMRKNGEESVSYPHSSLEDVLKSTYGLGVYQEQAMSTTQVVAGFDLKEADGLRKACGKKLPEEMAKVKALFLEKAKSYGVINEKEADLIFSQIEASQRYSFNKSHAAGYGYTSFDCAFAKAHNPAAFYAAWIQNATDKQKPGEERSELINEARLMGVDIFVPDFKRFSLNTEVDKGKVILGLSNIKGMGPSTIIALKGAVDELSKEIGSPKDWNWSHIICKLFPLTSVSMLTTLIKAGAFQSFGVSRKRAAFEVEQLGELTDNEWKWVATQPIFENTIALLKAAGKPKREGGGCSSEKRAAKIKAKAELLENPPFSLEDTPLYILLQEQELFGCGVSLTRVDTCDTEDVNCSCRDFLSGMDGHLVLGVEVKEVRPVTIKKAGKNFGREMAWLTVGDSTAELRDIPIFADNWEQYSKTLMENKTVYILGEHGKKKGDLVVRNIWPLKPISNKNQ